MLHLSLVVAGSVGGMFTLVWMDFQSDINELNFISARQGYIFILIFFFLLPTSVTPHDSTPTPLKIDSSKTPGLVDTSVILLNNLLPPDKKETTVIHSTHSIYKWMTYPQHVPPPEHCSSPSPFPQIKRVMDS